MTGLGLVMLYRELGFYGNWGGKDWSGGEYKPDTINWLVDGIDDLDRAFRDHDKAYYEAEEAGLDEAAYDQKIYEADKELLERMAGVDMSTIPDANKREAEAMRDRAEAFFGTEIRD